MAQIPYNVEVVQKQTTLVKEANVVQLGVSGFDITKIDWFDYSKFRAQVAEYAENETWFTGEALEIEEVKAGKKDQKYPIKMNPLNSICLKHAFCLFGEYPEDDPTEIVRFRVIPRDKKSQEQKAEAVKIADMLRAVFEASGGADLMMENAIVSQYLGGCIFGIKFLPGLVEDAPLDKFRIVRVSPDEFYGIPEATNPWILREAWIIRKITQATAKEYGVIITAGEGYYIEHWTPQIMEFSINGAELMKRLPDDELVPWSGPNPYGFVPFVYIPHIRGKGFLGQGLVTDSVKGLVREMNLRYADVGDAVNDDAHGFVAMRGVHGSPDITKLKNGLSVVNLGSAQGLSANDTPPDIFAVRTNAVSQVMVDFSQELYTHIKRETFMPSVADGEDQGSQRSSLNLQVKFWPLVSHTKMERVFWSTGLQVLGQMLLKMMNIKGVAGVTPEVARLRVHVVWFSILPKDREQLVNEVVMRMKNYLGSPEMLMEKLGDIDDVDDEGKKIEAWMEKLSKLAVAKQQAKMGAGGTSAPGTNNATGGKPSPRS